MTTDSPMPPRLPTSPARRSWPISPVLVTALVYPGVGQLMQRRWWAAGITLVSFTAAAFWFFFRTAVVLIDYYQMAFDFSGAQPRSSHPRDILVPFAVALGAYVGCVLDAALGNRRLRGRAT